MDRDAELYDEYLDSCLSGDPSTPDAFFAEHPEAGTEVRARIRDLYRTQRGVGSATVPFERLGEYRLLDRLDTGGMGAVYVAEQESLGRIVALKIVRPGLQGSDDAARRFEREARAIAQLRHENIVTVFGAGSDQGVRYLAMEMVPGRMLSDVLAAMASGREAVAVRQLVRWIAQLARALDYAHSRGIVHRDVKPSNIRITPDGRPLLLDFGIAYDMGGHAATMTRTFAGSPTYAAPEQITNRAVDGRTDVYALGVTLYQALTGVVPFAAETVEGVFHKTLTEPPVPPRRLRQAVSRDLETVTLKAMEKEPATRYASAAALADDLEAVLEHRPVAAHPPGPLRRARQWTRRHPAATVAAGAAVLLAALLVFLQVRAGFEARAEAAGLVRAARGRIADYRARRRATARLERVRADLQQELHNRYFTEADYAELARAERDADSARRAREEGYYEILDVLRRAEQLDPDVAGTSDVRAELFVEKWEEARVVRDPVQAAFFRRQVEQHDPAGRFARLFASFGTLEVESKVAGVDCYLFALREQSQLDPDGERRLVPVPVGGVYTPRPPGTPVLRVVVGSDALRRNDLILEIEGHPVGDSMFLAGPNGMQRIEAVGGHPIRKRADLDEALQSGGPYDAVIDGTTRTVDSLAALTPVEAARYGGIRALVYRNGATSTVLLVAGVETRLTAAPLFVSPACRIGRTPLTQPHLAIGRYLLLARREGHEDQRFPLTIRADTTTRVEVDLLPEGSTPPGFVHVPADARGPSCFLMEREVSCAEYLAFLNDPATLRRVDASPRTLVPRGPLGEPYWERTERGFALGDPWRPDYPVLGVSFDDAQAYVAWASARDGAAYALPTEAEWCRASGIQALAVEYPFGDVFLPKYASSNWARPKARVEPCMSYPVDESALLAFDMSGSAMEWLDAWWVNSTDARWLAGGAWGYSDPVLFRVPGGWGSRPHQTTGTYGFRMVLRR